MLDSVDPLEFTLTCTSTGGPATTVEWWRSGKLVQEDSNHKTSQMIVSTSPTGFLAAVAYKSFLKVKGRHTGRYHCNVSNAFPSSNQSATLIISCKLCICSIMFLFIVTSSLHQWHKHLLNSLLPTSQAPAFCWSGHINLAQHQPLAIDI